MTSNLLKKLAAPSSTAIQAGGDKEPGSAVNRYHGAGNEGGTGAAGLAEAEVVCPPAGGAVARAPAAPVGGPA